MVEKESASAGREASAAPSRAPPAAPALWHAEARVEAPKKADDLKFLEGRDAQTAVREGEITLLIATHQRRTLGCDARSTLRRRVCGTGFGSPKPVSGESTTRQTDARFQKVA
jgi:hypothetical protein